MYGSVSLTYSLVLLNAQPKAPACFDSGPGQTGAFGWAFNSDSLDRQLHSMIPRSHVIAGINGIA